MNRHLMVAVFALMLLGGLWAGFSSGGGWVLEKLTLDWSQNTRFYLLTHWQKWLPGDTGALAGGLMLGGYQGLSLEAKSDFRTAGILHLMAASGYNLSLVVGWLAGALQKWLHKRFVIVIVGLGTIVYMSLAGWSGSIVRAGIMALLTQLALLAGRPTSAKWLLVVTAGILALVSPALLTDISFQLSVAATAGIVWWKDKLAWLRWSDLQTTLVAQLATQGIIWHYFGQISLWSVLANLAVGWTIPLVMPILALGALAGPLNWLAWPLLRYILVISDWLASWPGASLSLGRIGWVGVIVYYLALMILFWGHDQARMGD